MWNLNLSHCVECRVVLCGNKNEVFFFSSETNGCGEMWHPRYKLKETKW